jgi:hypothetical protein
VSEGNDGKRVEYRPTAVAAERRLQFVPRVTGIHRCGTARAETTSRTLVMRDDATSGHRLVAWVQRLDVPHR